MQAGMMWFDNDNKTSLITKVNRAAAYYCKKYGRNPDLCMANPKMLTENDLGTGAITIRPYHPILPGHLWIGIDNSQFRKKT